MKFIHRFRPWFEKIKSVRFRQDLSSLLVTLFILLLLPVTIFLATNQNRQEIRKQAQEENGNQYSPEALLALGMRRLEPNEFATIKRVKDSTSGPAVTTSLSFDGFDYQSTETKDSALVAVKGSAQNNTYVFNNPETTVHQIENLSEKESQLKIDPAIKKKFKEKDTVPVIIRMDLPFSRFYEQNESEEKVKDKQAKFSEQKEKIKSLLRGKSQLKQDLTIINGLAADIDLETLENFSHSPALSKVELDREVKVTLDSSPEEIKATDVWNLLDAGGQPLTGLGTRIAIIDTGVDYTHPDLGGCFGSNCKVMGGYDCYNNDSDPMDDHGHGTHVAATAAGKGVAATGQRLWGIAPDARILAYKVLSNGGSGSWSNVICGINRATDPNNDGNASDHADVASMSLGGSGNPDDSISLAVDNSTAVGVVHTIAAGNSGPTASTIASPGTARTAITVAAACKSSQVGTNGYCSSPIASFSSRGPLIWNGVDIQKPDIAAPGVYICAAEWDGAWSSGRCFDDKHVAISGTSMATPHVAGSAALIRQAHPDYTPAQVKQLLKANAKSMGLSANDQGAGLVDLKAAIPLSQKLTLSPSTWTINSDPTQKNNSFQQTFSVTPLTTDISTLAVNLPTVPGGLTINTNKQTLQVANKTTDSFTVTVTLDNDTVKAGYLNLSLPLSQNGTNQGIVPITVVVKPTITVTPLDIDYGTDDPSVSQWTSAVKTITVTNLRKDIAQTVQFSTSTFPTGITLQTPTSISIPAGGSSPVNSNFQVDNNKVANNFYSGTLNLTSPTGVLQVTIKFKKYYVLTIQDPNGTDLKYAIIWLHDRTRNSYLSFTYENYLDFYLNTPGTYDVGVLYDLVYDSTGSHRPIVLKEGIAVNQGQTTVAVARSEAKNTVKLVATDSTGTNRSPLSTYAYVLRYQPSNISLWSSTLSFNSDLSTNYFSNVSSNYLYTSQYTWPSFQAANPLYFFPAKFNGLQSNLTVTNTAADFKTFDLQWDTDQTAGSSVQPVLSAREDNLSAIFTLNNQLLTLPVTHKIFSLMSAAAAFSGTLSGLQTANFSVSDNPERWLSYDRSTPTLPISERKVYGGLGPTYWAVKLQNSKTAANLYPNLPAASNNPAVGLLRQDFTIKDYSSFPFSLYQNGNVVGSGTLPGAVTPIFPWGSLPLLASAPLPTVGRYELRADIPYTIRGLAQTGKVTLNFDVSQTDPNPPAITALYFWANGTRSEVYDPSVSNHLEFALDPVGGSLTTVEAAYSTDGTTFQNMTLNRTCAGYAADLPSLSNLSRITLRLTAVDNTNNSLSYLFQLPVGIAPSAGSLQPIGCPTTNTPTPTPGGDNTPPTISINSPTDGAVLTGKSTLKVNATASDASGLARMQIYLDSTLLKTCNNTTICQANTSLGKMSIGLHTITVNATDNSSQKNVGNKSVQFSKQ